MENVRKGRKCERGSYEGKSDRFQNGIPSFLFHPSLPLLEKREVRTFPPKKRREER